MGLGAQRGSLNIMAIAALRSQNPPLNNSTVMLQAYIEIKKICSLQSLSANYITIVYSEAEL